jgi:hypothetical protein
MEYELFPSKNPIHNKRTRLFLIEDHDNPQTNIRATLFMDMETRPGAEIQGNKIFYVYTRIFWDEKNGNEYFEEYLTQFTPAG